MLLRSYQDDVIRKIRVAIREGDRNVLAVAPTGSGKTVMASFIAKSVVERGHSCWFVCHRDFLVTQTAKTFMANDLDMGVIAAGYKATYEKPLQVCMIDTLKNRLSKLTRPNVIMWDEAHHVKAPGWERVHAWANDAVHIGWTATPQRLDGKGLRPPFEAMVLGPTTLDLINNGALSDYVAYAPSKPNLRGVHTLAGDYNQREMAEAVERSTIVGDIIGEYTKLANGLRAVYFCPSIKYSKALAEAFSAAGVPARHVDGETPTSERAAAAIAFAQGQLSVLTNVALFGEGYDLAAQAGQDVTIEAVGLVRPTQSLALHRQQIGRCLRPKDRKAVIIDHAGNLERHGLPCADIDWSLDGKAKVTEASKIKICPHCTAANKIHAVVCSDCGNPFVRRERRGPDIVEGQLEEVDKEIARQLTLQRRAEVARCQTHQDYIALGIRRGYHPSWAHIQWRNAKAKIENQARAYLRDYR